MSKSTPMATTICFVVYKWGIKHVVPYDINGRK